LYRKELLATKLGVNINNFSIFTGTEGPNRKLIIETGSGDRSKRFFKIPVGSDSPIKIQQEYSNLKKQARVESYKIPKAKMFNIYNVLELSNEGEQNMQNSKILNKAHISFLKSQYRESLGYSKLINIPFYKQVAFNLSAYDTNKSGDVSDSVYTKLTLIYDSLAKHQSILHTNAHKDFTPWNVLSNKKIAYVYDWEMSEEKVPLFYDLFHFEMQKAIMLDKKSPNDILKQLKLLKFHPFVYNKLKDLRLDFNLYLKLYLLSHISYYLHLYQKQEKLHEQVYWQLNTWNKMLSAFIPVAAINMRSEFIESFFSLLKQKTYSILKYTSIDDYSVSENSDIDLLIKPELRPEIISFAGNNPLVERIKIRRKSFMSTLELYFYDGSFLSIDLIEKFMRKSLHYLNEVSFLKYLPESEGKYKVANVLSQFDYVYLFYLLNHSDIPEKHRRYYQGLPIWEQEMILKLIRSKYRIKASKFSDLFRFSAKSLEIVNRYLNMKQSNSGMAKVRNGINYLLDTLRQAFYMRGHMITLSGVDGVGKTTIINNLVRELKGKFRKRVVVLRHRPSVLPILSTYRYGKKKAEKIATVQLPHEGSNRNKLSSLLRFAYYFTDYLLGHIYVFFRYLIRGYVVVYDRYYFDFIADSRRSNLAISKKVTKFFYRFVHKPDLNFFLYASPDIIRRRKQELSKSDISRMTKDYTEVFESFSEKYTSSKYSRIENVNSDVTLSRIMNVIKDVV